MEKLLVERPGEHNGQRRRDQDKVAELLFEVFCEEIPARMQRPAAKDWEAQAISLLTAKTLSFHQLNVFITPRRLALWVDGLSLEQPAQREVRRGPRIDAPPGALEGFFKSVGKTRSQCQQQETPKGTFWVAPVLHEGKKTAALIPDFCQQMLTQFTWPKSMRWGNSQQTWVRPVRRLLCLFDGAPLIWTFDPLGAPLISGAKTQGHRFLGGPPFEVKNFRDYQEKLEKSFVMLDAKKRQEYIQRSLKDLASSRGLKVLGEDFQEGGLLDEVTGLVEWPVVLLGKIDPHFLSLPEEVLTTPMRLQQRYFPLKDPQTQRLAPFFGMVANMQAQDKGEKIVSGNERVLRARLFDAQFFFEQDLKKSLAEQSQKLQQRVFFQGLGTVMDKVFRLRELALFWEPKEPFFEEAAAFCKADLASLMVGEFPELQGVMGMYYAREEGLDERVALAIRDHYWPQGVPTAEEPSPLGCALGIIDRIDTLVGFFALGLRPTGSKDPMALRRAGLALVQLILKHPGDVFLRDLAQKAFEGYHRQGLLKGVSWDLTFQGLLSFLQERLKYILKEKEALPHDQIEAVLAGGNQGEGGEDTVAREKNKVEGDFKKQARRVRCLHGFLKTSQGAALLFAYRRVASLLRAEEKKDHFSYQKHPLQPHLLKLPEERALINWLESGHFLKEDVWDAAELRAFATLPPLVDRFFDAVTVNDPNQDIRKNRLALLASIRKAVEEVADFSKLEG